MLKSLGALCVANHLLKNTQKKSHRHPKLLNPPRREPEHEYVPKWGWTVNSVHVKERKKTLPHAETYLARRTSERGRKQG